MLTKSSLAFVLLATMVVVGVEFGRGNDALAQTPKLAACPINATLSVSAPVVASPTTVSVVLQPSQNIKPASAADPSSLHLHYFIDTDPTPAGQTIPSGNPKIIHSGLTIQDLGPLSLGNHVVWVVLGQLDHTACSTRGSVSFTYAPPPTEIASGEGLTEATASYRFQFIVNPPETMLMPDMAGNAKTGEVMVQMPGTPMMPMSMTDQGMPINHHVEVHVFNKATGAVVMDMVPTISLTNEATGATRILSMGTIMAMYGLDVGMSDFHFGNNVYLSDGSYNVSVSAGGQTAVFPHVSIKASGMDMMGPPAMAPAIMPPNTGDGGLAVR